MYDLDRNHEPATLEDSLRDRAYVAILERETRANTQYHRPPSEQIAAWRSYERGMFAFLGRNPPPAFMGYNLWADTAKALQWAHDVLAHPAFLKSTGFTKKTAPRRALAMLARAFGFRYMRGLESVEHGLDSAALQRFKRERKTFREVFSMDADAAHAANATGKAPEQVLELVQVFAAELKALVPWLELAGRHQDAKQLLDGIECIGGSV